MKTTILTTLLAVTTATLLSGCAGYSFIDNRYENKTQVNIPLRQALEKVKYIEVDLKAIFHNNDYEINNIIEGNRDIKTCTSIINEHPFSSYGSNRQSELKGNRLEPLEANKYKNYVFFGQSARMQFCFNKAEESGLEEKFIFKDNCDLVYEDQREEDLFEAKSRGEFMELGYINYERNIYVPNINPLKPEEFYTYKAFNDNLTGSLVLELSYKDHKNRTITRTLYEELQTCEFATRSKKEVIKENEEKIKIQNDKFKKTGRMY